MPCHTVLYRNYTIYPSGHTIKMKHVALYKEVEADFLDILNIITSTDFLIFYIFSRVSFAQFVPIVLNMTKFETPNKHFNVHFRAIAFGK